MASYKYAFYEPLNGEDIFDAGVSNIEAFMPNPIYNARPLTEEEKLIVAKRQQETAEYILKCKNVIFELDSSLEQSSIRK